MQIPFLFVEQYKISSNLLRFYLIISSILCEMETFLLVVGICVSDTVQVRLSFERRSFHLDEICTIQRKHNFFFLFWMNSINNKENLLQIYQDLSIYL